MPNLLSTLFAWLAGPARARARGDINGAVLDASAGSGSPTSDDDADGTVATSSTAPAPDDTLSSGSGVPGWYGKVPALGDFASRRLPDAFVAAWDAWLSEGIEAAAEAIGPGWEDICRGAPPWRFVLAPGVIDARAWIGVMVPSMDRVGRSFPLTIAAPCAVAPAPIAALEQWWEGAAGAAASLRDEGATLDAFEQTLVQLGVPAFSPPSADEQNGVLARVPVTQGLEPALGQAVPILMQASNGISFWWARLEGATPPIVVVRGLPKARAFAALLDRSL